MKQIYPTPSAPRSFREKEAPRLRAAIASGAQPPASELELGHGNCCQCGCPNVDEDPCTFCDSDNPRGKRFKVQP